MKNDTRLDDILSLEGGDPSEASILTLDDEFVGDCVLSELVLGDTRVLPTVTALNAEDLQRALKAQKGHRSRGLHT